MTDDDFEEYVPLFFPLEMRVQVAERDN
jgi:hypothetical protein